AGASSERFTVAGPLPEAPGVLRWIARRVRRLRGGFGKIPNGSRRLQRSSGDAETAAGASGSGRQPRRSLEEHRAPVRCAGARSPDAPAHVGRIAARSRDAPPGVRHFAVRLADAPRAGRWNAECSSRGRGLPLRNRLWLNALHHEREVEKMATI